MAIKSDWQSGIDRQNLDESDCSELDEHFIIN